jgi:hypothetical protein
MASEDKPGVLIVLEVDELDTEEREDRDGDENRLR